MPQHSTRPDGPQTWVQPSNEADPRQLPLPFERSISAMRWPETATSERPPASETGLKSPAGQVHGPKRLRTAARHRWDGHRCRQCGLTREGQDARFTGHFRYTTTEGHPGDCPGNPPDRVNTKPRVDATEDAAELARRRAAKSEMRRQINEHKRRRSGET